jgi:hypothetical protein
MRKLLTFLIALGAVVFGVCSPASAWGCREFGQQGGTGCNSVIASTPPAASYSFLGAGDVSPTGGSSNTFPITMTGVAGRLIFASTIQNNLTLVSVVYDPTGANISLTQDFVSSTSDIGYFFSANVPAASGAKNIVVTYTTGVGFLASSGAAWLASNLTTGFVAGTGNNSINTTPITVSTGQFLFSIVAQAGVPLAGPSDFSGSTSAPTGTRLSTVISPNVTQSSATADWASPSVGTFTIAPGATAAGVVFGATYQ